ncbi:MAG: SRPBCC family protein [Aeromicrobium erythreum]
MTTTEGRVRHGIHVEARLDAAVDRVWALTQEPRRHERWDVRFGRIRPTGEGTFCYRRFGVAGTGEHAGERRRSDGSATSALRFACPSRWSPIEEGSGYWRYAALDDGGTRFETGYDYRSRYPRLDRLFRPVMAWGTAWSFDRLRLWADRGLAPELTAAVAVADVVLRLLAVAVVVLLLPLPLPLGLTTGVLAAVVLGRLPAAPWAPSARRTTWSAGSVR